ncbi:hypothetical protein ACJX0J_031794, partial [Zea mays]
WVGRMLKEETRTFANEEQMGHNLLPVPSIMLKECGMDEELQELVLEQKSVEIDPNFTKIMAHISKFTFPPAGKEYDYIPEGEDDIDEQQVEEQGNELMHWLVEDSIVILMLYIHLHVNA